MGASTVCLHTGYSSEQDTVLAYFLMQSKECISSFTHIAKLNGIVQNTGISKVLFLDISISIKFPLSIKSEQKTAYLNFIQMLFYLTLNSSSEDSIHNISDLAKSHPFIFLKKIERKQKANMYGSRYS